MRQSINHMAVRHLTNEGSSVDPAERAALVRSSMSDLPPFAPLPEPSGLSGRVPRPPRL